MNLSVERVVALLTPAFAAVSGALVAWLGTHFPGLPHLNPGNITALEIAGTTAGAGAALKWLHGRAQFTRAVHDAEVWARHAGGAVIADPQAGPAVADIEQLLKTHTDQIVQAITSAVHAPPSVAQVVDAILSQAAQAKTPGVLLAPTPDAASPEATA